MKDAKGHGSDKRGGGAPRQHPHASISAHTVHRDIQRNSGHWQPAPKEGFLGHIGHMLNTAVHTLIDVPPTPHGQSSAGAHTVKYPWPYGSRPHRGLQ